MTPQPDFLRPVRGPHPLAWLACATAFAVLGVAALDAWDAWQGQPTPAMPVATPARSTPPSQADSEARRSLTQAAARLERPWSRSFSALDTMDTPGVAWLALEIGDGGRLRLQGQAPDTRAAMAAAESLRRSDVWRDALLGRMEAAPGGGALRFEISAEAAR